VLLGFATIYRRWIRNHTQVTLPLTELLKMTPEPAPTPIAPAKALGKPNKPPPKWKWTRATNLALWKLNRVFSDATNLQHFIPANWKILQADIRGFAFASIVNQYAGFGSLSLCSS
jgi:hypothetical protein